MVSHSRYQLVAAAIQSNAGFRHLFPGSRNWFNFQRYSINNSVTVVEPPFSKKAKKTKGYISLHVICHVGSTKNNII